MNIEPSISPDIIHIIKYFIETLILLIYVKLLWYTNNTVINTYTITKINKIIIKYNPRVSRLESVWCLISVMVWWDCDTSVTVDYNPEQKTFTTINLHNFKDHT